MKPYSRQLGSWTMFGLLMLVSLAAWGMGSTGLALALAIGAVGAMGVGLAERLHVPQLVRRIVRHG